MGCWLIVFGYFIAIAIDAFIDKAKLEVSGDFYGDWWAAVAPHIGYALGLLFLVCAGVYIGW
jgi:hypothetical protein